ncbi:aromatic-ring-hydroxylating dioxygenase subunit beta [Ferrovibrio xuzhouensis]|uniref:Aromatic-ring-hydroxylating dioxygenase subunit beta n=1 Tax=Ferrovibrio xuzhouensis TaxID=1576914 RepID=A0ABV7VQK6_9PROT
MSALFSAICRAQTDYARCIDDGKLEAWPDFFLENCLYKITTADNHRDGYEAGIVYAASRGMLKDRISALREANIYERHAYRHILGQPAIDDGTNGDIRSETAFLVVRIMRDGRSDIYATGRYLDVYRLVGDTPKLAERVVVCDSSRIDTLLALPL